MADHLRTELVLAALQMALWNRRPAPGVIHHSDHGCQYTAITFGQRFTTKLEARLAVFGYLETFYNRERPHSALGYLAPADGSCRRPQSE